MPTWDICHHFDFAYEYEVLGIPRTCLGQPYGKLEFMKFFLEQNSHYQSKFFGVIYQAKVVSYSRLVIDGIHFGSWSHVLILPRATNKVQTLNIEGGGFNLLWKIAVIDLHKNSPDLTSRPTLNPPLKAD